MNFGFVMNYSLAMSALFEEDRAMHLLLHAKLLNSHFVNISGKR